MCTCLYRKQSNVNHFCSGIFFRKTWFVCEFDTRYYRTVSLWYFYIPKWYKRKIEAMSGGMGRKERQSTHTSNPRYKKHTKALTNWTLAESRILRCLRKYFYSIFLLPPIYIIYCCHATPFQLDSMETQRFRNYSRLATLVLTGLFCRIKVKRDQSLTSDESLAAEPSAHAGDVWGAPSEVWRDRWPPIKSDKNIIYHSHAVRMQVSRGQVL